MNRSLYSLRELWGLSGETDRVVGFCVFWADLNQTKSRE
jgi:hypothetical protein